MGVKEKKKIDMGDPFMEVVVEHIADTVLRGKRCQCSDCVTNAQDAYDWWIKKGWKNEEVKQ